MISQKVFGDAHHGNSGNHSLTPPASRILQC
jgi:hypothetical protein